MLLHTARGVKASAFKNVDLLYVHCVSEEKFTVSLKGFSCVTLVCRETHVSYLENMSERRRCLIPDVVENQSMDVLLERKAAPLLVRVNSSCDITNLDPNNLSDEGHKSTLLWSFEILPAPAAEFVKPSVVKESPLDEYFPPVIIDGESWCNCASHSPSPYCLVSMICNAAENLVSIASEQETDSSAVSSEDECSAGEEVDDVDTKEYFTDTFPVKGSFWEGRYQESLIKCVERKAKGENVGVRACFETDNWRDKNAIKFEVLYFNAWHVIGYCSVEKIPKLTKAIRRKEISSCKLKYVKRKWVQPISAFRYYAAVSITKQGQWDRNDPKNKYNSVL